MSIKVLVKKKKKLNEADNDKQQKQLNNSQDKQLQKGNDNSEQQQKDNNALKQSTEKQPNTNGQLTAGTLANTPLVDVNKFVTEVQNLYTGLVKDLKTFFIPDNIKKNYLTSYDTLCNADLYKGKEKAFADAVNNFAKIDEKNTKDGLQAFSALIGALQAYVQDIANTANANNVKVENVPNTGAQANNGQAAPAALAAPAAPAAPAQK